LNLLDELKELQQLHASGFLTDDELARAKARVLGGDGLQTSAIALHPQLLELIRLQNELLQLDLDWNRRWEGPMLAHRYGYHRAPDKAVSCNRAIAVLAMGLAVVAGAAFNDAVGPALLITIPLVTLGLGYCFYLYSQASSYEMAETDYLRQRILLKEKLRKIEKPLMGQ
jgi:hypothetical protein